MSIKVIRLELDEEICRDLRRIADRLGLSTIEEALRIAAADWTARRKAEIDNPDYFINEALDELLSKKR